MMRHSNLLFIVLFALAVAGCSAETDYSSTYPKQFHDNFFNACVREATKVGQRTSDAIQKSCICAVNAVKKNISFPDYSEMEKGLINPSAQTKKGEATYQQMMKLAETCY